MAAHAETLPRSEASPASPLKAAITRRMLLFVLGIATCAALAVYSIVEDPKLFAWVAGLLGVGLVLWFVSRAIGGPPREPEPGTAAAD